MNASQKRCFVVSVGFHASLLLVLVLTPALATRRPPQDGPEIIMLPSNFTVTDNHTEGSGAEQPVSKPQPPAPMPAPAPIVRSHVEERPEPKPKPNRDRPEPKKNVEELAHEPAPNIFERLLHHHTSKAVEDPEGERKPKKPDRDDKKTDQETAVKPGKSVKLASDIKRHTSSDDAAAKKAAAEEAARRKADEEADRQSREAQAARKAGIAKLQHALAAAEGSLTQSLAAGTEITMPGPGRAAFLSYFDYLHGFYKANWKKPAAIARTEASVGAEITVLRDGTLKDFRILEPSGVKELDDSVREVLRKYRNLRPLPAESTDPERTFSIRFTLTADTPT